MRRRQVLALASLFDHGASEARLTGTTSEHAPFDLRETDSFEHDGTTYETSAEEPT
jgi:hypothetical protein